MRPFLHPKDAQVLTELVSVVQTPRSGRYCLTGTLSSRGLNRQQIKKELRSRWRTGIREPTVEKWLPRILTEAEAAVDRTEDLGTSLVILQRIDPNSHKEGEAVRASRVVAVKRPLQEMFRCGRLYDLTSLVIHYYTLPDALVIRLNSDGAQICAWNGERLKTLLEKENDFLEFGDTSKEYLERMTAPGSMIFQGNGTDKITNVKLPGEHRKFINSLADSLGHNPELKDRWHGILVYHSTRYEGMASELLRQLRERFAGAPLAVSGWEPATRADLIERVSHDLVRLQQEWLSEDFSTAREAYPQFAEGWLAVADSLRQKRVRTLWLPDQAEAVPGYVGEDMVSAEQQPDSEKVDDLLPWLVRQAVCNSCEVLWRPDDRPVPAAALHY